MQKAGLNSIRTSIQWSRLIEDFETGKTNPQAVAFYNRVIDTFLAAGIRPMMNLHHFDLPVELLHKYGGWENKKWRYSLLSLRSNVSAYLATE